MPETIQQNNHFLIYVDESGDHSLINIDKDYPVFVLVFCIFDRHQYIHEITPSLMEFKCHFWGHSEVVLHEHEIRKPKDDYIILFKKEIREIFLQKLNLFMEHIPLTLIASVIDKNRFIKQYTHPANPYEISLSFGLERVYRHLCDHKQENQITPIIVEKRGKVEDNNLELAFRRICDGVNYLNKKLPFTLLMTDKKSNSTGLQIADLMARPIGIKTLQPQKPNRAYDIIQKKFRRSSQGVINGWGLKVFP